MVVFVPERFKRPKTKGLDGSEYELNSSSLDARPELREIAKPEQPIIALKKLRKGKSIWVDDNDRLTEEEKDFLKKEQEDDPIMGAFEVGRFFTIDHIQEVGDKVIIEMNGPPYKALKKNRDDKKEFFFRRLMPLIDFRNEILREKIIKMLSNVFTPLQLRKILEEESVEMLMFEEMMYLKVGDKAYRL